MDLWIRNLAVTVNNRDLAIIIWFTVFILWMLSMKQLRKALLDAVKAFFNIKIIVPFGLMLLYVAFSTQVLSTLGLWDQTQYKTTLFWTITSAVVMFFNFSNVTGEKNFFKNIACDNFKVAVLIDFLINLYVFNIFVELLIVPCVTFLSCLLVMAQSDQKYKPAEKFINIVLTLFGFSLLGYAGYSLVNDFSNAANLQTIKNFTVPMALSLILLPFIYIISVIALYEEIFVQLGFKIQDTGLRKYVKRQLIIKFNFRLCALKEWAKQLPFPHIQSKQDILESIKIKA